MKIPPPPTARLRTPNAPLAPPVCAFVVSWIESVIHESSPASATSLSPGFSVISRTGSVVPLTCDSIPISFQTVVPARYRSTDTATSARRGQPLDRR